MAFNIKYIYKAIDKFTPVAESVVRSKKKIQKKIKQLKKEYGSLGVAAQKAGAKMAKIGGTAFVRMTAPITAASVAMVKFAGDAEETRNKFDTVFRGVGGASKAAQQLANDFDLAGSTAQQLLSDTGAQLVNGLGLTREEALKLSEQVVSLSGDVASFNNIKGGAAATSEALRKALLGEREMLKTNFNIAILEKEVQAEMVKVMRQRKGLTEKQAKALATLNLVTRQSTDAIGDYAKTRLSYSNQEKAFAQNLKAVAESFGKILLPAVNKVLIAANKFLKWLEQTDDSTKKWILRILGVLAVIGPLLLALGTLAVIAPLVAKGFMMMAFLFKPLVWLWQGAAFLLPLLVTPLKFLAFTAIPALLGGLKFLALTVMPAMLAGLKSLVVGFLTAIGPIGWIIMAVIALGAGLVMLYKKSEKFRNAVNALASGVVTAFKGMVNHIAPIFNWLGEKLDWLSKFGGKILMKLGFSSEELQKVANDNSVVAQQASSNVAAASAGNNIQSLNGQLNINVNDPKNNIKSVETKIDAPIDVNTGTNMMAGR